ncbi:LamB/YcsF family protein [Methylocella silvestris BL2]|uniref:LamB/YcsF family protein n=1 Tax=Methylocella silvestris (strain DSM 15510 / CIP 108128 / LMG 27833 / NCIMB 13906 / BL2) TaxID=395965 RepID=B8ESL6_METSB|nr:5-oxoprolinase subunit PxpA [Methylocella silvestris]ACK50351.1 LamB/YcsF family protein [Methylocella silvestris BL2]
MSGPQGESVSLSVDLNCDCGEGFGPYAMGDDAAMLEIVSSASVACGFHAGDPQIMAAVFATAREKGVALGAHPGYPDLWGFGRRPQQFSLGELERLIAYQIGAALGVAALAGCRISYVKIHGALSNLAMVERDVARALAHATKAVDRGLSFLAIAGTPLETEGAAAGLDVAREIYADRAYTDEGLLAPRAAPGAVLTDKDAIAARVLAMIGEGAIIAQSGKRIAAAIDSICVHGDHHGAVATAKQVRTRLEAKGIRIAPFAAPAQK